RLGFPVLLVILGLMIFIPMPLPSATTQGATQSDSKTVQYPTYQFASWAGGGTKLTNDTFTQEAYMPSASVLFPWGSVSYANWCNDANTTTTKISGSGTYTPYNPANYRLIVNYQMPYLSTVSLDGYGFQCAQYSRDAIASHPDLATYDKTGLRLDYTKRDLLRVDDMNFAVQTYRDLVNLKNNLNAANPRLLDYWYGLSICSGGIWCDGGTYYVVGNGMLGNVSVGLFAGSKICVSSTGNMTYGSCTYLSNASKGMALSSGGHPCCRTSVIYNQLLNGFHSEYAEYVH